MRRTRAFTVFEILVSLALLAIVSAVIIPGLMGRIRDARTSALGQTLFSLSLAIFEYEKAVSVYPPQLIYLSAKPTAAVTDACGTAGGIGATNANNWRGPYVTRELVTNGVNIGDARIEDRLRWTNIGGATRLFIDVEGVDTLSAVDLEKQFDGTPPDPTTGTLRYQKGAIGATIPAAPAGQVNLSYGIPITGC